MASGEKFGGLTCAELWVAKKPSRNRPGKNKNRNQFEFNLGNDC